MKAMCNIIALIVMIAAVVVKLNGDTTTAIWLMSLAIFNRIGGVSA